MTCLLEVAFDRLPTCFKISTMLNTGLRICGQYLRRIGFCGRDCIIIDKWATVQPIERDWA